MQQEHFWRFVYTFLIFLYSSEFWFLYMCKQLLPLLFAFFLLDGYSVHNFIYCHFHTLSSIFTSSRQMHWMLCFVLRVLFCRLTYICNDCVTDLLQCRFQTRKHCRGTLSQVQMDFAINGKDLVQKLRCIYLGFFPSYLYL